MFDFTRRCGQKNLSFPEFWGWFLFSLILIPSHSEKVADLFNNLTLSFLPIFFLFEDPKMQYRHFIKYSLNILISDKFDDFEQRESNNQKRSILNLFLFVLSSSEMFLLCRCLPQETPARSWWRCSARPRDKDQPCSSTVWRLCQDIRADARNTTSGTWISCARCRIQPAWAACQFHLPSDRIHQLRSLFKEAHQQHCHLG